MFEKIPSKNKKEGILPNWIIPNAKNEIGEIQRVLIEFLNTNVTEESILSLVSKIESAPLTVLTEEIWEELQNTESFHEVSQGDFRAIDEIVTEHNKDLPEHLQRDWKSILQGFQGNNSMEAPVIIKNANGVMHLLSGNTRLLVARALGVQPQVIIIESE